MFFKFFLKNSLGHYESVRLINYLIFYYFVKKIIFKFTRYIDSYFRLVENPKLDSNLMNIVFPLISTLTGIFMNVGLWQLKKIGIKQ